MNNQFEKLFNIHHTKHTKNGDITVATSYKRKIFFIRIFQFLLILVFLGIAGAVSYVSFYGPVRVNNNWIIPGNRDIQTEQTVIATENQNSFATRLNEAGIQPSKIIVGKIIAGNYGKLIQQDNGTYLVQNSQNPKQVTQTNIKLDKHGDYLNDEYIVRCTSGNGVKGKDYLISSDNIKGQVNQKLFNKYFK